MIEVDVFWSWSFGALFAATAAGRLRNVPEAEWWREPSFIYNVLFLSLIFGPSGQYLLWEFPYWESMFVFRTKDDIPALLATAFAFTNTLLGIIGYYLTYREIRRHKDAEHLPMSIHKYWVHAYTCFNAILGMGYNRFAYPSDDVDWHNGVVYPLESFIFSPVCNTLLVMAIVLLPAAYLPCWHWLKKYTLTKPGDKGRLVAAALYYSIQGVVLITAFFGAYIVRNHERNPEHSTIQNLWALVDNGNIFDRNSRWSPILGFYVAEVIVLTLVSLPVFFVPSVKASASSAKGSRKTIKVQ